MPRIMAPRKTPVAAISADSAAEWWTAIKSSDLQSSVKLTAAILADRWDETEPEAPISCPIATVVEEGSMSRACVYRTMSTLASAGWLRRVTPQMYRISPTYMPMIPKDYRRAPKADRVQRKQQVDGRLRTAVYERDAYRCRKCGTHLNLSIDHIIPESQGGPTTLDNLQTLCMPCNTAKYVSEEPHWQEPIRLHA